MNTIFSKVISLVISLWIAKVFLFSLPYKFTNHPDTQHIFTTIGQWMSATIQLDLGLFFSSYGAYIVGTVELVTSILLLIASLFLALNLLKVSQNERISKKLYFVGGLLSAAVMSGAVFFHLFTPLGIKVIHEGKSDNGSLFFAAVSIIVLGLILAFINKSVMKSN
jgi:hypothetical protein